MADGLRFGLAGQRSVFGIMTSAALALLATACEPDPECDVGYAWNTAAEACECQPLPPAMDCREVWKDIKADCDHCGNTFTCQATGSDGKLEWVLTPYDCLTCVGSDGMLDTDDETCVKAN